MLLKDLFTTLCLLTGQAERAAGSFGVRFFLPELFRLRYANMGGLDVEAFTRQLDGLKSFRESAWCGYWNAIAREYEAEAEALFTAGKLGGEAAAQELLIKALTYYTVSAFPGDSPLKLEAYRRARDLFERLAPMMDDRLEKVTLRIAGEEVAGYARFPEGDRKCPMVIITNGLEGTFQEIALPLMKYRDSGLGVFFMEMPGTYAYEHPMSRASEDIYSGVIEHFASHPRVDAGRMAMIGVSFGGYWSARMAAVSPRLSCAVVCGAPLHHTFQAANSLGVPEIFVSALMKVTGTRNAASLYKALSALSFEKNDLYRRIGIPLLIINGDNDTLIGTNDSIVLDARAPRAFLKLYEHDDHCAMGHYREWLDLTFEWLQVQFGVS
jgi:esterase FrsA